MPVWCVAHPTAAPCGHFAALPLVRSPATRSARLPSASLRRISPFCVSGKQAHDALNQSPCGFRRETPARGFGRSSLVVGQWVFLVLLSHSRRYAIRRVRRLASLAVCRRVVLLCRARESGCEASGLSHSLRGRGFAHDSSDFATRSDLRSVDTPNARRL